MGWKSFFLGSTSPNNRMCSDTLHPGPLHPESPFPFPGRPALWDAAGSASEIFPLQTFLGLPTLALSCSVTFQTQNLGTSHLPKHAVTCANAYCWFYVIWLVPAILPFKSQYPPIFSNTDTLSLGCSRAWAAPKPILASLCLCEERLLTLLCSLRGCQCPILTIRGC